MGTKRYNMAFTTGGLLLRESVRLAALYLELADWDAVRSQARSTNVLQARKASTGKRWVGEIILRLQTLSDSEIRFLVSGNPLDQASLLWLAICRRFVFIGDFMTEVVRERYLSLRNELAPPDFDAFVESKTSQHPELAAISPSTRIKLRQVLFQLLREASLLSKDHQIMTPTLGRELATLMMANDASEIRYFPITENDFRSLAA
jgi:hypothetical protein